MDIRLDWDDDEEDTLPGNHARGSRVLVAEDDEAIRRLVTTTLKHEGYDVSGVVSGVELLQTLQSLAVGNSPPEGVDLIVLDFRMPGPTGLEVMRKVRAARWKTPAILMTALAEPAVITAAKQLDVSVLVKPFPLEVLTRTAFTLLSNGPTETRIAVAEPGIENGFRVRAVS